MPQEIRPEEADKGAREPDCHDMEGFCCAACAQKFWTRFQNLPAELREMVYVRTFQALPNISVPSSTELGSNSPRTPVVPPVCYVNKSVLAESLPAILASSGKAIVVQHHLGLKVLSKFLARVPDERTIKSVQELHLPWEYAFSPHLYPGTLDLPFWRLCSAFTRFTRQTELLYTPLSQHRK
ncbi:hypothetical protein HBI80_035600 [Parastagonospora nodorum]|nr:hypothetical protein HBH49_025890 [Parastagonospora nodorum]KAH4115614.1 hypothetical protein HBH47_178400 [Parastagonospora nodorum]KAH4250446.1 hypothetical protein HBI03_240830 [Parastagonospora nodorum]KAH4262752.1 hypothetical protein HBI04_196250 [Parastagonospora nodorum]KAH4910753.1 hypothetical protein HBI80_035600 [Parastagonospora nodorum]